MRKYFSIERLLLLLLAIGYWLLARSAFAQAKINLGIPGLSAEPKPTEFIAQIYQFAIIISGVLALGAIVYGGIKYMTAGGNPSAQGEGREWIQSAIFGLLLLFGAYLVLNVINPDLTKLSLPALAPIPASPTPTGGGGGGGGSGLTQQQVMDQLRAAGIGFAGSIHLAGMQQTTIDELKRLKGACGGCEVFVTSATGGEHGTSGQCSHANGFKADIRPNGALNAQISNYARLSDRPSDGAAMYRSPSGAIYADETTRPPRCGVTCNWTAPHWDMTRC